MWNCSRCNEQHEESFEACWNCGTAKDGTPDPEFHPENDTRTGANETNGSSPEASDAELFSGIPCTHCGSKQVLKDVPVQSSHGLPTGLGYSMLTFLSMTEPLMAELCVDCGTVQRMYVRATDRNWTYR